MKYESERVGRMGNCGFSKMLYASDAAFFFFFFFCSALLCPFREWTCHWYQILMKNWTTAAWQPQQHHQLQPERKVTLLMLSCGLPLWNWNDFKARQFLMYHSPCLKFQHKTRPLHGSESTHIIQSGATGGAPHPLNWGDKSRACLSHDLLLPAPSCEGQTWLCSSWMPAKSNSRGWPKCQQRCKFPALPCEIKLKLGEAIRICQDYQPISPWTTYL